MFAYKEFDAPAQRAEIAFALGNKISPGFDSAPTDIMPAQVARDHKDVPGFHSPYVGGHHPHLHCD